MDILQIIGYIGSVIIAVSLMMNNIWRLRWVNLFGAGTFAIYGLLVNAYPVFALNSFIVAVDIFYLVKISKEKDYFTNLEVKTDTNKYLHKFITYYSKDIKKYFPDFKLEENLDAKSFFILRNMMPVGLFIYDEMPEGEVLIKLDYVIPEYRDLKNAHYLFTSLKSEDFINKGYHKLIAYSNSEPHKKYLKKFGFNVSEDEPNRFIKVI